MIRRTIRTGLFSIAALAMTASLALAQSQTSKPFAGGKVNGGTVTHSTKDGKDVLTLSDDFKVPDTPDPHWQVVDSQGQHVSVAASRREEPRRPRQGSDQHVDHAAGYIKDVAKVQIYCAWAEAVLGEAPFSAPLMTMNK